MSGLLGQLLGSMSSTQAGQTSPLVGILEQVLAMKSGDQTGIAALITRFQGAGLGEHVQSWVGTGANLPVTGEQIGKAFPAEQIQAWAQQAGTTPEALQGVLAQALPHTVDHMTPDGQPTATGMPDIAGLLGRLMGGQRTAP